MATVKISWILWKNYPPLFNFLFPLVSGFFSKSNSLAIKFSLLNLENSCLEKTAQSKIAKETCRCVHNFTVLPLNIPIMSFKW